MLLPTSLLGQQSDIGAFPELSGRVVDVAGLLNATEEASLSEELAAHEQQTGNQIVVATLTSLNGRDIADYANRLGRHWALGSAENDNGVLLLVAPAERKVRIEVGYGLEGALPDALASHIIQREILPAFRNGDYSAGIRAGVAAIQQAIAGEYDALTDERAGRSDSVQQQLGKFIPLIFIAMVGIPHLLRKKGYRKAANSAFPAGFAGLAVSLVSSKLWLGLIATGVVFLALFISGSSKGGGGGGRARHPRGPVSGTGSFGGGFSGSGGGGGFSGGGGSFGGGGASGSW